MGKNESRKFVFRQYLIQIHLTVFFLFLLVWNTVAFSRDSDSNFIPVDSVTKTQPWGKFSVNLGGIFSGYSSAVTIGSEQLGLGLAVDVERLLGLSVSSWGLKGTTQIRFGKKNRSMLYLSYFGVQRKSTKVLEKELEIGDIVIPLNTSITSRFNWNIFQLKYDYSFYQDDRVSLGASIGLYILPISFSIEIENQKGTAQSVFAPLPILGLRSDFLISKKFLFHQKVDFLYLSANGFVGSILDFDFSIEYRPIKHFGLGLGINTVKWQLSSDGSDYPGVDFYGDMEAGYTGIYAFGKFIL